MIDPSTQRIRNLSEQLDAATKARRPTLWRDVVAPWVTAVLVIASLVMIGYAIVIGSNSADAQQVASCRAEFNAEMQASSVLLTTETITAAIGGTLEDPVTQTRLADLAAATSSATTRYVEAARLAKTDPGEFLTQCGATT